jgi:hypothetical protein
MNRLVCIVVALFLGSTLFAQTQNFTTSYKVQLAAYATDFNLEKYQVLNDLGIVYSETEDGMSRVFLGNYLDKPTAQRALRKAKERGFERGYLVKEDVSRTDAIGNVVTHYIQLAALQKMNVKDVVAPLVNTNFVNKMYIFQEGDFYKIVVGMYNINGVSADLEKLNGLGFSDLLVRKIPVPVNKVETVEAMFMYGTNAEGEEKYTVRLENGKNIDLYAYVPVFGLFDLKGDIPMGEGKGKFTMIVDNQGVLVLNPNVKGKEAIITFETIPMDENFYPEYGFHPMLEKDANALNVVKRIEFK